MSAICFTLGIFSHTVKYARLLKARLSCQCLKSFSGGGVEVGAPQRGDGSGPEDGRGRAFDGAPATAAGPLVSEGCFVSER